MMTSLDMINSYQVNFQLYQGWWIKKAKYIFQLPDRFFQSKGHFEVNLRSNIDLNDVIDLQYDLFKIPTFGFYGCYFDSDWPIQNLDSDWPIKIHDSDWPNQDFDSDWVLRKLFIYILQSFSWTKYWLNYLGHKIFYRKINDPVVAEMMRMCPDSDTR